MRTLRVAVTGGREHQITQEEELAFRRVLDELEGDSPGMLTPFVVLLHGACRGVDQRAAELAESWGYAVVSFEAPWKRLETYAGWHTGAIAARRIGKTAGPLRNWMMLKAADLLVTFPGGRGTQDCIRQAGKLGVRVVRIGMVDSE